MRAHNVLGFVQAAVKMDALVDTKQVRARSCVWFLRSICPSALTRCPMFFTTACLFFSFLFHCSSLKICSILDFFSWAAVWSFLISNVDVSLNSLSNFQFLVNLQPAFLIELLRRRPPWSVFRGLSEAGLLDGFKPVVSWDHFCRKHYASDQAIAPDCLILIGQMITEKVWSF